MKVLFISANTETINILPLPLGLNYVAAATQNAGHEVNVLDLMTQTDSLALVRETLAAFHPDVIGISVRNIDSQNMQAPKFLLDEVKSIVLCCRSVSQAPIVLGGAGYSIFPEGTLAYLEADMGIRGEGEWSFPALLERLAKHGSLDNIPGLYLRDGGPQGKRSFAKDLDGLPVAGVHVFSAARDRQLWMPFQTRRGCPMDCAYCSTAAIEGRLIRQRSVDAALEEMAGYVAAGFHQFYLVDNTFNVPLPYAKALCEGIIRRQWPISWRCILYPGKADEELAGLMAKAGCAEVSLGFESGCERMLRRLNKKYSLAEVRETSRLMAKHGIRQMGFLMLGGPGETRASVLESLAFADSLPLDSGKMTLGIRIYPDTALAEQAVADGIIAPEDNLLLPRFYMVGELEAWLRETVKTWMATRPHWIM